MRLLAIILLYLAVSCTSSNRSDSLFTYTSSLGIDSEHAKVLVISDKYVSPCYMSLLEKILELQCENFTVVPNSVSPSDQLSKQLDRMSAVGIRVIIDKKLVGEKSGFGLAKPILVKVRDKNIQEIQYIDNESVSHFSC
jgi:predicted DNA-binding protein